MLYRIGKYLYDQDKKLLVADGELSITLKPKQAALLNVFIADPTRWYTSTELLDLVWQKQVVENASLYLQITNLRKQFGADAIENEKNKGYRFCLTVAEVGDTEIPVHFSDVKKRNRMIAIVLLVLFMFVFGVVSLPNAIDEETENSKPQAITFMKGQEAYLNVSENFMAFSHRNSGNEFFSIYMQENRVGAKPVEILSATNVHDYYYPYINQTESKLYYLRVDISAEKTICKIFMADLHDFHITNQTEVVDCGNSDWVSPFVVNDDETTIFYAHSNSSSSPVTLYRLDLNSGFSQQISLPSQNSKGDYNLALSEDNKYLAFTRLNSNGSSSIMALNIELGTISFIDRVLEMVNLLTWHEHKLIYTGDGSALNYKDMLSGKTGNIILDSSLPMHDGIAWQGDLYFSQGKIVVSDIISTPDFGDSYFDKIVSPFTDDLLSCNQLQCYFVSDRTGENQLYQENLDGSVTQISHFTQHNKISFLSPSIENKYVYYIVNGSLYQFDISNRSEKALLVGQNISSVAAGCQPSEYYVTRLENDVSNLYKVKKNVQVSLFLLAEQVKTDCSISEPNLYYLHSQTRDLHQVNLRNYEQVIWFPNFDTPSSAHWDVYQNEIIRLKGFYELTHWSNNMVTSSHFFKIPVISVGYTSSGELALKYTFAGEMTVYKQKIRFTSD